MSQSNTGQAHVAEISTQETETFIRQVRTSSPILGAGHGIVLVDSNGGYDPTKNFWMRWLVESKT